MADRPSNIVGEDDLGWSEQRNGQRFGHRRKQLASAAGGQRVGCSLYEVEPGRAAFPRHYHLANEEAVGPREEGIFAEFLRDDVGVGYYYLDGAEVDYYDGEEEYRARS